MRESEMLLVADWIARRLGAPDDETVERAIRGEVRELTNGFPVPGVAPYAIA
jgi:glycine/serine hydroxymethyltransferase